MSLLYVEEHLGCRHYQHNNPLIRLKHFPKGKTISEGQVNLSRVYFILKGSFIFNDNVYKKKIRKNSFFLIPPNFDFNAKPLEDVLCIVVNFHVQFNLCENFPMTELYDHYDDDVIPTFKPLLFCKQLSVYMTQLSTYLKDGVNCTHFQDIKRQELFFILRAYYQKEDLAVFFYPLLNSEDIYFKTFVMENCLYVKNIQDLAQMAKYSTSGFIKKFTRNFNESPYQWLMKYKSEHILHEIKLGEKNLKEISSQYNFSSMSHFINFCKKFYGETPGRIRKKKLAT